MKLGYRALRAMLFASAALVLSGTGGALQAQTPQRGGTVTIVSSGIDNLNPLGSSADVGWISGQVFACLTRLGADGQPKPYLAKSWEVSPDGLSYTFHLEDATFHDGKPVTSADVAFSVEMAKKYHRFGPQMFGPVQRVDTPDPKTAVFRLSEPHAAVLLSSTTARFLPIMPKHIYGEGDFTKNPAHMKPVGAGPFRFASMNPSEYIQLDRNETYFRKGLPYLDRIMLRIVKDSTAARIGLEKKEFDIAVASSTLRYRELKKYQDTGFLNVESSQDANGSVLVIDMNVRQGPLKDKRVRQAITHAMDLNFISKTLHDGWSTPGRGPIVSSNPFFDEKLPQHEFNLDKANRLLDEAGFPRKAGGIRMELRLLHVTTYPDLMVTIPEYMVPALARVGIKVIREPMPDRTVWVKRMNEWNYDMSATLPANYLDPVIGVSRNYVCDNIKPIAYTNTSGYCNPKLDEVFAKAKAETDFAKRKALYAQAQAILVDERPFVWAVESDSPMIWQKDLANVPVKGWGPSGPMDEMYRNRKP